MHRHLVALTKDKTSNKRNDQSLEHPGQHTQKRLGQDLQTLNERVPLAEPWLAIKLKLQQ